MLMYVLSNVVGQRLQRHVVECQVSQRSELSETIRQSEAARQEGEKWRQTLRVLSYSDTVQRQLISQYSGSKLHPAVPLPFHLRKLKR